MAENKKMPNKKFNVSGGAKKSNDVTTAYGKATYNKKLGSAIISPYAQFSAYSRDGEKINVQPRFGIDTKIPLGDNFTADANYSSGTGGKNKRFGAGLKYKNDTLNAKFGLSASPKGQNIGVQGSIEKKFSKGGAVKTTKCIRDGLAIKGKTNIK